MVGRYVLSGEFVFVYVHELPLGWGVFALSCEFVLIHLHATQMRGRFALSREFVLAPCMNGHQRKEIKASREKRS